MTEKALGQCSESAPYKFKYFTDPCKLGELKNLYLGILEERDQLNGTELELLDGKSCIEIHADELYPIISMYLEVWPSRYRRLSHRHIATACQSFYRCKSLGMRQLAKTNIP